MLIQHFTSNPQATAGGQQAESGLGGLAQQILGKFTK
jgi:hypothetical protein